jgi:starch synthase (maltosyl-transferring)
MLYCGRVSRRKGAYDLAAAWQLAAPHLPDWRLLVVGEATEREAVARLRSAASATGGRLLYRGFVPPGDVPRFMRAADVLVHASYGEGLANVTFEAMASGLPIVSSNVDGQPEAIIPGETGWLVPPRNPRALADALIDAATDAAARGVQGARARRIACERFARSRQAASLAAILGDVARCATPTRA